MSGKHPRILTILAKVRQSMTLTNFDMPRIFEAMSNATPPRPEYRLDIQGLRGIAILLVVFYHSGILFRGGYVGVDVFFVISGFVITSSLLRRLQANERFGLIEFYGRRIRRLLPALAAMLVVVLGMSTWLSTIAARSQTIGTGLSATFSMANLYLYRIRSDGYFVQSEKANALIHTWSLSIEEQFYLLFPLLILISIWVARQIRRHPVTTLKFLSFGVGIVSLVLCIAVSSVGFDNLPTTIRNGLGTSVIDRRFAFYLPFTRAWEFLAGVWLATFHWQSAGVSTRRYQSFVGVGFIAASALFFSEATRYPGIFALLPVVGASLVIDSRNDTNLIGNILSSPYLRWLGDRSYGWYLWHWPVIQFVHPFAPGSRLVAVCAGFAALIPAMLSYRFLENPLRKLRVWRTPRRMALLISLSLTLPIVAIASTRDLAPELGSHLGATMACEYGNLQNLSPTGNCTIPISNSVGQAVLIGDSHAGHLSEAFVKAAHANQLDATIAVNGNNPYLFVTWDIQQTRESYPFKSLEIMRTTRPRVVVIAQSVYNTGAPEGVRWADQFIPILQQLEEMRIPVVVVAANLVPGLKPRDCSPFQIFLDVCPANQQASTDKLLEDRKQRLEEEHRAIAEVDNSVLMDAAPILCPATSCSIYRDGKWWWRDSSHLSIFASQSLIPLLTERIREALLLPIGK